MNQQNRRRAFISLICGLLTAGCSSENPQAPEENLIQLVLTEDLQISSNIEDVLLGNFSGLAVDSEETIYIGDRELQKIHLFSSEGDYLESIGRKGRGPGEFVSLDSNLRILADTLYIRDSSTERITFFDLKNRRLAGTLNLPDASINGKPMGRSRDMFPVPDGKILVSFVNPYYEAPQEGEEPHKVTLSLFDKTGQFVEKDHIQIPVLFPINQRLSLLSSGAINVISGLVFYPDIKIAVSLEGNIFIGNTDSLSIRQYNERGEIITTFAAPSPIKELTATHLDSLAHRRSSPLYRNLLDDVISMAGLPDHWPAFEYFLIDDVGRCWIKLLHSGKTEQVWWVFDEKGQLIWSFLLPTEVNLYQIENNNAYGIRRNSEDLGSIIRYKIEGL